jgi:hypothetical protein
MARRIIDFTEDSSLRQTIPAALSFSYIRALVEQHLGADAAAMLSEPQVVPRQGHHQWLAEAAIDVPLVRLDRAPTDQAEAARRTLDEVRWRARRTWENLNATGSEQKRQEGVAILRAFEVPQDSECVWLIGERPLLVGWGHEKANVIPPEPAALALTYRRPVAHVASRPAASTESETVRPPPAPEQSPRPPPGTSSWLTASLWLLFVALTLGIGGLLLPACSIHIPGTQWGWTWAAGCTAHAQNPLADLIAQNRALDEALRAQRVALEARDFCPPAPRPEPVPTAPNLPTLPPNVDIRAPVQVRLDWDTNDDLDLVVGCPSGGWISPLRQHQWDESCGDGKRDLDANNKMRKRDYPTAEHIRWHNIHPGRYRVIVWPANTGTGNPIPFRVTLTLFGQTQTCSGEVVWDEAKGEGYLAYVIDFDPARPLPSCNVGSTVEGHLQVCTTGCGKD